MGHRGCEAGGGREFFALAQDLLRFAVQRCVAEYQHNADQLVPIVTDGRCAVLDRDQRAIASLQHGMVGETDHPAEFHDFDDWILDGLMRGLVEDRKDVYDLLPLRLRLVNAEKLLGHRVEERHAP